MNFTLPEIAAIGALTYFFNVWETTTTKGERPEEVELANKAQEKRLGAQAPTQVINQKELELIKRDVKLPCKPLDDPSLYDAQLDMLLKETQGRAAAYQPMRPERLEEYGNASWMNAGKIMTDMLYFKYPREPVRPPMIDQFY